MGCTTLLVGKKASYDGSTMTARNEDAGAGNFSAKKFIVVQPEEQPRRYKSVISGVEIDLPDNPMRYTCMPDAVQKSGIWGEVGVNECNVSMTATETLTSNERVHGADPLTDPKKGEGIGEEDIVTITLPYIHSAREGVLRLGMLHETYGTYEMNGIAFQDLDEIWWFETVGGHNWMAVRVPDEAVVIMPNQLGIDRFDFDDAYGEKKNCLCSPALREITEKYHLNLNLDGGFNPRWAFGSHMDFDHSYNTPRAWNLIHFLCPKACRPGGIYAHLGPESDDIPWAVIPERKLTPEDVKYALSLHYQGTPYDPYGRYGDGSERNKYRTIGINRNNFLGCVQLRPYVPAEIMAVEWVAFGSNVFNAFAPFYANVDDTPAYMKTGALPSTENLYWSNRLIAAMADASFPTCGAAIDAYARAVPARGLNILVRYDEEYLKTGDVSLCAKANEEIAAMLREETDRCLDSVLKTRSLEMKNRYARSDA